MAPANHVPITVLDAVKHGFVEGDDQLQDEKPVTRQPSLERDQQLAPLGKIMPGASEQVQHQSLQLR